MEADTKATFSLMVVEGNRKYEFAVMENGGNSRYIVISAAKNDENNSGDDSHRIIIPEENLQAFYQTFLAVRRYLGYGNKSEEGKPPRSTNPQSGKSGMPWSEEEDAQLRSEFAQGLAPDDIALKHQRSGYAIRMRLEKLGLIPAQPVEQRDRLPQSSSFTRPRK